MLPRTRDGTDESRKMFAGENVNVATSSAVTPIWRSMWLELLVVKSDTAIAAFALDTLMN
jgi:hypothetical protein